MRSRTHLRSLILALGLGILGGSFSAEAAPERPLYYEKEITPADLDGRTLRELTLLRNTIYARTGHAFRKKWLADYFTSQSWYKPVAKPDNSKLTATDRKNAQAIATYEEGLTRKDLLKRRETIQGKKKAGLTAEDEIELRLLSAKLGEWQASDAPSVSRSPLEDPSLLEQLLTVKQLENLSRRDLRILRNTIYARRGRPFKSEILQAYFSDMGWYQIDAGYSDKKLTATDKRNIKMVRSVEDSLGGPLSDHDHKEEDGWLFEA